MSDPYAEQTPRIELTLALANWGSGVIWNGIPFETPVIPAKLVPAFAGMTAPGSARVSQMTPLPKLRFS